MIDFLSFVERYTTVRKVAATGGGEWAGACPVCRSSATNGKPSDRFRVQPDAANGPAWMCRTCTDGVWRNAPAFVLAVQGETYSPAAYAAACRTLEMEPTGPRAEPTPAPPVDAVPPSLTWRLRAEALAKQCYGWLWADIGADARAELHRRGLTDDTIRAARLGFNPSDSFDAPELWGLEPEHKKVWFPAGIVIPWFVDKQVWRLNVRRTLTAAQQAAGEPKYLGPAGSANGLYNAHTVKAGGVTVICEGELDALSIRQQVGDQVAAVATGSTGGSRRMRWLSLLLGQRVVLCAYDADQAGDRASLYWECALGGIAQRLRPCGGKDASKMLEDGVDVRTWVLSHVPRPGMRRRIAVYTYACPQCGAEDVLPDVYVRDAYRELQPLCAACEQGAAVLTPDFTPAQYEVAA